MCLTSLPKAKAKKTVASVADALSNAKASALEAGRVFWQSPTSADASAPTPKVGRVRIVVKTELGESSTGHADPPSPRPILRRSPASANLPDGSRAAKVPKRAQSAAPAATKAVAKANAIPKAAAPTRAAPKAVAPPQAQASSAATGQNELKDLLLQRAVEQGKTPKALREQFKRTYPAFIVNRFW